MTDSNYDYDAIIIGAGISGLVCGCYLAKAGLRTLILEKNAKPGGYCTSFTRNGFHFDACVYSLSSCRRGGSIYRVINEFNLTDELQIIRHEIPDIIITPNYKINLYCNVNTTIIELQKKFLHQKKAIRDFFEFLSYSSIIMLTKLRKTSFEKMLNSYFDDPELKTILSIVLLGYTGLPPSQLSAFVACLVYKEFIFDGGYYPRGGMQTFSDALANKFIKFGGEILLSTKVQKIKVEEKNAKGIITSNKDYISARSIVAACDIRETFFKLIKNQHLSRMILRKTKTMQVSLSAFLVYLGVSKNLNYLSDLKSHNWVISKNYKNVEKIYSNLLENRHDYLVLSSSSLRDTFSQVDKQTVFLFVNTPFVNKSFWNKKNKDKISNKLVNLSGAVIPNLKKYIKLKVVATPFTLYKYTLNYHGACYGRASTISQFGDPDFSETTEIKNLYLTGHWSNKSSGITSVVNSGYTTAMNIIGYCRDKNS